MRKAKNIWNHDDVRTCKIFNYLFVVKKEIKISQNYARRVIYQAADFYIGFLFWRKFITRLIGFFILHTADTIHPSNFIIELDIFTIWFFRINIVLIARGFTHSKWLINLARLYFFFLSPIKHSCILKDGGKRQKNIAFHKNMLWPSTFFMPLDACTKRFLNGN